MLPCLEWAAFRTWVMPSLCNVFLFCATALGDIQNVWGHNKQTLSQNCSSSEQHSSCYFFPRSARGVSPQRTLTHTFPMYRLGQTSSTGVSSSVQESKMCCSSLMSAKFRCWWLPDIFSPQSVSPNKSPNTASAVCNCFLPHYHSANSSLRDTSRCPFEYHLPPKLDLCTQRETRCGGIIDFTLFPEAKGPILAQATAVGGMDTTETCKRRHWLLLAQGG